MSSNWQAENAEKWREYKREWAAKNPEKIKAHRKSYRAANKDVIQEKQRAYYAAHPEKQAARDRLKKYRLTEAAFSEMLSRQEGRCAVCRDELTPGRGTHVDHCHATGCVRELLCKRCNLALGHTLDQPERLEALAAYLRKHATLAAGAAS